MTNLTDAQILETLMLAAKEQGLSLHIDPVLEEAAPEEGPGVPSPFFLFGRAPKFTENILHWRAFLVVAHQRNGDGFVASGPTPQIALRALWAAYTAAREGAAEVMNLSAFDG